MIAKKGVLFMKLQGTPEEIEQAKKKDPNAKKIILL